MQLFGDSVSGNCYKLQLACAELQVEYDWGEVDILCGDTRREAFLAMNPNGKVPVMVLSNGDVLAESNAILSYLAEGSDLTGDTRLARARVMQWLFFEQYSHEPYIATSRFIIKYLGSPPDRQAELDAKRAGGYRALSILEGTFAGEDFIANNRFSIADIALFAYTHVADEGGFDLGDYPGVRRWISRVENRPRYVAMKARSGGD